MRHYICIKNGVSKHGPYQIPTTTALVAFEHAARFGSFAAVAKELGTSQPAVSHNIAMLERHLGVRLFDRSRTGVSLTEAGRRFHDAVSVGLGIIQTATSAVANQSEDDQLVIACSIAASHYFVLPRYDALRKALGEQTRISILIFHHDPRNLPLNPVADVVLTWERSVGAEDQVVIFKEAVRPVCSPDYAAAHADTLNGPVSGWNDLTLLDPSAPDAGWATWEDWFEVAGLPETPPRLMRFDNCVYLLEAAVAGHGIAIGWRNYVDRYLETGALVGLGDGYVERDNHFCGILTQHGRLRPVAWKCLSFFEGCVSSRQEEQAAPSPGAREATSRNE